MFEHFSIWANASAFGGAAAVVWLAGTRLAGYADGIANRTNLGQALVGMLLLGGVTSLPELVVGVSATLADAPMLTVNDILDSASINLLILALADAVYGRDALTSTPGTSSVLLQGALSILLLAIVVAAITSGDTQVAGMGGWSWLLLVIFLGALWIVSKSRGHAAWVPVDAKANSPVPGLAQQTLQSGSAQNPIALTKLLLRAAGVALAIMVAGYVLAGSAEALAEQTGVGHSFFGAVMLGAATSLPEVSTVLAAVRLKRYEMALAGVFGSNLFNVIVIVIVDALYAGSPVLAQAGRFEAFGALLGIILTVLYLVGLIERRDRTVLRMGIDSLCVLVAYAIGIAVLYQLR